MPQNETTTPASNVSTNLLKVKMSKIFSGRLWLTIITGIVFAYCSITKILNAECISAIVSMVFISYFQRGDRNGSNTNH